MFALSKALNIALEPLFWVLLSLLAGVLLSARRPRLGRRLCSLSLLALLLSGWVGLPSAVLRHLEGQSPPPPSAQSMGDYAGVVVLGGSLSHWRLWSDYGQVALNERAERLTTAVSLARQYPALQVVFTGGVATRNGEGHSEAQQATQFFREMGLAPDRVQMESGARNTAENATLSARLPGVDPGKPWLLLTSAYHMPRAIAAFEAAGWNVRPYPVDYRTTSNDSLWDYSLHYGPRTWTLALHETIGLWVYRWMRVA